MRIAACFIGVSLLNEHLDFFRYAPLDFIRAAANYVRWSLHLRESILRNIGMLHNIGAKILCLLLLPVAFILYFDDEKPDERNSEGALSAGQ